MDAPSFVFASVLNQIEWLHSSGYLSTENYGQVVAALIQADPVVAAPPPVHPAVKKSATAPAPPPARSTSRSVTQSSAISAPVAGPSTIAAEDKPAEAKERGWLNSFINEQYGDGQALSTWVDAGLKLHPFLSKTQRKAFVVREFGRIGLTIAQKLSQKPLSQGVNKLTDPNAQIAARKSTARAFKTAVKRKSKQDSTASTSAVENASSDELDVQIDEAGEATLTTTTRDGVQIYATEHSFEPLVGIRIVQMTRLEMDPQAILSADDGPATIQSPVDDSSLSYM